MSDWRQIQARIRKAKTSSEPAAQLAKLFERTRDAMAAFELAGVEERAGNSAEAIRWYTVAAQRFRRADWKTKAHDGLTRLGAAIPETASPAVVQAQSQEAATPSAPPTSFAFEALVESAESEQPATDSDEFFRRVLDEDRPTVAAQPSGVSESPAPTAGAPAGRRRRHRGRRGGRGRRKGKAPSAAAAAPTTTRVPAVSNAPAARTGATGDSVYTARPWEPAAPPAKYPDRFAEPPSIEPRVPVRGRPGDPALSSRQAYLESQLRRLLAATPHSVGDADSAPAGPGVFLVSDSDQITYYYVEACQTLRIGIANLLRERRGRVEREPLRARFAENLGIPEARVSKYLKDNCLVRWLQLDDGASNLAHFAIAVLRPALND